MGIKTQRFKGHMANMAHLGAYYFGFIFGVIGKAIAFLLRLLQKLILLWSEINSSFLSYARSNILVLLLALPFVILASLLQLTFIFSLGAFINPEIILKLFLGNDESLHQKSFIELLAQTITSIGSRIGGSLGVIVGLITSPVAIFMERTPTIKEKPPLLQGEATPHQGVASYHQKDLLIPTQIKFIETSSDLDKNFTAHNSQIDDRFTKYPIAKPQEVIGSSFNPLFSSEVKIKPSTSIESQDGLIPDDIITPIGIRRADIITNNTIQHRLDSFESQITKKLKL